MHISKSVLVTQIMCVIYGITFTIKISISPMLVGDLNPISHKSRYRSYVLFSSGFLATIVAIMILYILNMAYLIYFDAIIGIVMLGLICTYLTESPVFLVNNKRYDDVKDIIRT